MTAGDTHHDDEPGTHLSGDLARFAARASPGEVSPSPDGTSIAYTLRGPEQSLWRCSLKGPAARPVPLGPRGLAAYRCVWCPDGRTLLVTADDAGSENYRLIELDSLTGAVTWSAGASGARYEIGPVSRCGNQPFSPDGRMLAYSVNARDPACFDVVIRDRVTGEARTVLLGDDCYYPVCWSADGTALLIHRMCQNTDHDLYVYRLGAARAELVTPHTGQARYLPAGWSADGRGIYLATNAGRDMAGLAYLDLSGRGQLTWLAQPGHEVDFAALAPARDRLLWAINIDGYTELHVRDLPAGTDHTVRGLPHGVAAKELGRFGYAPQFTAGGRGIVTMVARATAPAELYFADLVSGTARRLTFFGRGVPEPESLVEPEVVRYPSIDGSSVPALLYRPQRASPAAPVPVVISIHGGPEYQAFPEYSPLHQYLLSRGIGVLEPNYSGSTGFGLAYQRLVYRDRGGRDLADLAKAAEFLAGLDWVDGGRLGLYGESYGGFAVLSCISRLPHRWAVAAEFCGRSDLTDIARSTPVHWRGRLADWIGDPVSDAGLLAERSPLNHVSAIRTPLLVGHGENDPRVPRAQSDQIVERLRGLDRPVSYLVLPDDGHSPSTPANSARWLAAAAQWLVGHLAPDGTATAPVTH